MGRRRGAIVQAPRPVQPAPVLQVQEAEIIPPQQLEPQPVTALADPALGLVAAQRGEGEPRRQRPLRQPGRELAREVDPAQAVARRLVALRSIAGEIAHQMGARRLLAACERRPPPREGSLRGGFGGAMIAATVAPTVPIDRHRIDGRQGRQRLGRRPRRRGLHARRLHRLAKGREYLRQTLHRKRQRRRIEQAGLPQRLHLQPRRTQGRDLVLFLGRSDRLAHHPARAQRTRQRRQHLGRRTAQLQQPTASRAQGRIKIIQCRRQERTPVRTPAHETPARRRIGGGIVAIDRKQARARRTGLDQREVVAQAQIVAKPVDDEFRGHQHAPARARLRRQRSEQ